MNYHHNHLRVREIFSCITSLQLTWSQVILILALGKARILLGKQYKTNVSDKSFVYKNIIEITFLETRESGKTHPSPHWDIRIGLSTNGRATYYLSGSVYVVRISLMQFQAVSRTTLAWVHTMWCRPLGTDCSSVGPLQAAVPARNSAPAGVLQGRQPPSG